MLPAVGSTCWWCGVGQTSLVVLVVSKLPASSQRRCGGHGDGRAVSAKRFAVLATASANLGSHGAWFNIRYLQDLLTSRAIRRQPQFEMAANKEEQKPQKASKYYPAEDVAVPKKVCSPMRYHTDAPQRGG
jgi:hypothetical protein